MEQVKKERKPIRAQVTKVVAKINDALVAGKFDDAADLLAQLNCKYERLIKKDCEVLEYLRAEEGDVEEEINSCEEYHDAVASIKSKFLRSQTKINSAGQASSSSTSSQIMDRPCRGYELPKLDLATFSGDAREWFEFWGSFISVHEDPSLPAETKFRYLKSCTVGKAKDAIETLQITPDNYDTAIKRLKVRFASDKRLINVYVRELLHLVLSKSERMPLSSLVDRLSGQLKSLARLGVSRDKYDFLLYPLVEAALPKETLRLWERHKKALSCYNLKVSGGPSSEEADPEEVTIEDDDTFDDLHQLMRFLSDEVEGEETAEMAGNVFGIARSTRELHTHPPTAAALAVVETDSNTKVSCIFCTKGVHMSQECMKARKMSIQEKKQIISEKRCCLICLKPRHIAKFCKTPVSCFLCSKRHHAIMCPELGKTPQNSRESPAYQRAQSPPNPRRQQPAQETATHCNGVKLNTVVLQTLRLRLLNGNRTKTVRALCDNGSHLSYITSHCAKELDLKPVGRELLRHNVFGGLESHAVSHDRFRVNVQSTTGDYTQTLLLLGQETICAALPKTPVGAIHSVTLQEGIVLSDSGEGPIDVLLGADILGEVMNGEIRRLDGGLLAIGTKFGWMLMGSCSQTHVTSVFSLLHLSSTDLWSLETLGIRDPFEVQSLKQKSAELIQKFEDSVETLADGRLEVELLWKATHPPILSNRSIAESRLLSVSKKLCQQNRFEMYDKVFQEWKAEEIIEEVDELVEPEKVHYLPHRPVFKASSHTTKVRPVFDASAQGANKISLNMCLETGPNNVELIPSILHRFRSGKYAATSDIRKAFLQVSVKEKERDYLRFLWWKNYAAREIAVLRHRRVVFGLTCSPFLLEATLNYHFKNVPKELQPTAKRLQSSLYVDNCVTSADSVDELTNFKLAATEIMRLASFDLRGWESNLHALQDLHLDPSDNPTTGVLGLLWNKEADTLSCAIQEDTMNQQVFTKRTLLSLANRIFDPIGFLCPVTLIPKILLQETWRAGIRWDSPLPDSLNKRCESWCAKLTLLKLLQIPRHFGGPINAETSSLHIFGDASKEAYASAAYLRIRDPRGPTTVRLVQAIARVAPIKRVKQPNSPPQFNRSSIPRLELLAALISVRLGKSVIASLNCDVPTFYWTDSKTVLYWIRKNENWDTFVFNRIREIRQFSKPSTWRHVPGSLNPADLPSRGCDAKTLLARKWWEGPSWLLQDSSAWPTETEDYSLYFEEINSERSTTSLATPAEPDWSTVLLRRFSKYTQILRLIAWILRWKWNALRRGPRMSGELHPEELKGAQRTIFRQLQEEYLKAKGSFGTLLAYKGEDGLFHAKSRVLDEDQKPSDQPIILPPHPIVKRLIEEAHCRMGHVGAQTLATPIFGRNSGSSDHFAPSRPSRPVV